MKMKHFLNSMFLVLILVILGLVLVACGNDSEKMKSPIHAYFKDIQKTSFSENDYESEYARKDYFSKLTYADGAEDAMNAALKETDIVIEAVMGSQRDGTGSCDIVITTIDISSVLGDADNDWDAATSIIKSKDAPTKDYDVTIDLVYDKSSQKWIIDDTSPIVEVLGEPYSISRMDLAAEQRIEEHNDELESLSLLIG